MIEVMNTVTKTMTEKEIETLYQKLKPLARQESQPAYTRWQLKTSDMTTTAYKSGKVVFQGKDVSWLADDIPAGPSTSSAKPAGRSKTAGSAAPSGARAHTFPMAGSDEVGTGDYFGPIVVAAVIVDNEETAQKLKALHITDSKAMNDAAIRKAAPLIAQMVPHSIETITNPQYNQVWNQQTMNINRIKALMHNRAYLDLSQTQPLPDNRIVDQFCAPNTYYAHVRSQRPAHQTVQGLHFETKAEGKYIAVAAASVLARAAFLDAMDAMDKKYDFHFEKGAGPKVDQCGRKFLQAHPSVPLEEVAKVHFANTRKIRSH